MSEVRRFLDPSSVSKHLYCSICMEVFFKPLRAPCGHSFCAVCIEQWLKSKKACPEDRKPLRRKDMHHDFILENIIGDQMVACPYRDRGCSEVLQLALVASHKKSCGLNPENLPQFLAEECPPMGLEESISEYSESEGGLGDVPVMSLKMRLYQRGGETRQKLCEMFHQDSSAPSLPASTVRDNSSRRLKRTVDILSDDSDNEIL